ncbi:MAG: IS1182 family transposase [Actinomycetota bacterium]|nr:IS1182 family transposase [Actinomycetota bacterium]
MQGKERVDRELLDAAALAGHLVPAGSMFAFLAAHRGELFPDGDFADLFPSGRGRPSIPASVMATVLTLQALCDYSDAETAEAARCDLRWKVACGFAVDHEGFDPSTLVYWRRRLAVSPRPDRVNDAVRAVIAGTGILRGRRCRAVDGTVLDDAVATQDTITQLISAIRKAGRLVPGAAELIPVVCTAHDYSRPGKPVTGWDDPQAKDALVSALVNDALALLAALEGREVTGPAAEAVALLALVAGQDVEPAEGSDGTDGRWRIAQKVAEDRVVSTVDPEARHARKSRSQRRDGYRAHVAADPETGIITDERLTRAAGDGNGEPDVAAGFVAAAGEQASDGAGPVPAAGGGDAGAGLRWYGDSAYGTGELREVIRGAGDQAVIKPKPVRPAVEGGFTLDDFTIDHDARRATCPAGVTRPVTATGTVTFGAACRGCPLRSRCTTARTGRSLQLHPRDQLLRQARARWAADPGLREDYRHHRPNVERAIAQVATTRGRRIKLRYRGTARNNAWLKRRTAALNLRNLISCGLTRQHGTWALAAT